MHINFRRNLLPGTVFFTGACVLIIEVVATRVLSPFYGNTIYSVSSVISVILAALSGGYWHGGKLADRQPHLGRLFKLTFISGVLVLLSNSLIVSVLPSLSKYLPVTIGPLFVSLVLFFIPAYLLGMVSPYAVKLQTMFEPEVGVGTAAGKIFFWGTFGSIAGSLLAGFYLIPTLGVDYILMGSGVALMVIGALGLLALRSNMVLVCIGALVAAQLSVFSLRALAANSSGAIYSVDGVYERISIHDSEKDGRPIRIFRQDKSDSGAMYLDSEDPTDLVYEYTEYYKLYRLFKNNLDDVLIIGGGAYSIPKAILAELPHARVTVSEIEPSLVDLARKYFRLASDHRLSTSTEDGRRLLAQSDKEYDLIFSDVYYSLFSIPGHFTTQEFFSLAKSRLKKGGFFVANLIGNVSRRKESLLLSEIKTFQTVFEKSFVLAVDSPIKTKVQNILLVGYDGERRINLKELELPPSETPFLRELASKELLLDRFDFEFHPLITDNYMPVDYLTSKVLSRIYEGRSEANGKDMLATIEQQLDYGPRYLSSEGHSSVQALISADLKQFGAEMFFQPWRHKGVDGTVYSMMNIVGKLFPERPRRIIIGTHYDSKRIADKDGVGGGVVPGANDSASGVAVLLEIARVLVSREESLAIGLDLVFFDGEEGEETQASDYSNWKPLGSSYFVSHLSDIYPTGGRPESGVILDMVCDKNLELRPEQGSLDSTRENTDRFWALGEEISPKNFSNKPRPAIRDDHTILTDAGIPSFLVIDFDYPAFHTSRDTLDKCSARSLETVAQTVLRYVDSYE